MGQYSYLPYILFSLYFSKSYFPFTFLSYALHNVRDIPSADSRIQYRAWHSFRAHGDTPQWYRNGRLCCEYFFVAVFNPLQSISSFKTKHAHFLEAQIRWSQHVRQHSGPHSHTHPHRWKGRNVKYAAPTKAFRGKSLYPIHVSYVCAGLYAPPLLEHTLQHTQWIRESIAWVPFTSVLSARTPSHGIAPYNKFILCQSKSQSHPFGAHNIVISHGVPALRTELFCSRVVHLKSNICCNYSTKIIPFSLLRQLKKKL